MGCYFLGYSLMHAHSHTNKIQVKELTVSYHETLALENISGTFEPGSLTAIIGPNGGGKSTFIKALQKLIRPSKGSVTHYCKNLCDTAYLPQKNEFDTSFPLTVFDVVGMGLLAQVGAFKAYTPEQIILIKKTLEKVGLNGFENRLIGSLSGGQFQRMLFARIFMQDASLIILDEPFTAIDTQTCTHLIKFILDWNRQGKTVLVALHNLDLVEKYFPETVLLGRQCVGWGKTSKILTEANIKKAFKNLMV